MGITTATSHLTVTEEQFLRALLWEELHLRPGSATLAANEHALPLLRLLEVANRLSPNLSGDSLARIQEGSCPVTEWPWPALRGSEVLELLWKRLGETGA